MDDAWAFAREERARHLPPDLPGGYVCTPVEREPFWEAFEADLAAHFPPEVFFDLDALRPPERREAHERLRQLTRARELSDFWLVHAPDGQLAAAFSGASRGIGYVQYVSTVHTEHRRRGLYSAMTRRILAYTAAVGFDRVESYHSPANNPILLAKLGLGFNVVALEVDPGPGTSVKLCYFHSDALRRAYEFRCGSASLDDELVAAGTGAMALLRRQLGHVPPEPDRA